MALALIKIKIMPDSPQADLNDIEKKARDLLEKQGSKSIRFEREPIAFGLIAVIAMITWEEELSIDPTVEAIQEFKNVSSAEVIDFRRAIG
jgi:elongation factor 1-beta